MADPVELVLNRLRDVEPEDSVWARVLRNPEINESRDGVIPCRVLTRTGCFERDAKSAVVYQRTSLGKDVLQALIDAGTPGAMDLGISGDDKALEIEALIRANRLIDAIKLFRHYNAASLKEAHHAVEHFRNFGRWS